MLKELKKLRITETLAEILESTSSPSANVPLSLSNLILKVMMVMHPSSKELLVANTNGSFHCEVLLERRHSSKKRVECDSLEEDIPTVALIRKRILALGKRAEDLYYQRNSLQNEKYEFQCQLEQQANSLKDMDNLLDKTDDLQDQVATLRSQQDAELQRLEQERHAMDQLMQCKEDELVKVQTRMESLEAEASSTERQIEQLQSDKVRLQGELDHLKDIYAEEEGKAERSSAVVRRQEEEVRSLKQAVKKAHELYEKVSWQLEQEVQEKSALQTVVNHIRRQQDKAQRELCEEKVRKVEQNFKAESDGDGMKEATFNHCKADMVSPSAMDQRARSSGRMGSELDELDDGKHRQRRCENSALNVSDRNEPSTLVSPLPSGIAHFLNEWQQLDLSKVLNDTSSPTEVTRPFSLKSALLSTASSCDASCQSPTHERNERLKIDKANAAVNDYMNRIDSKLNRMYGIPPSSAIQRSTMEYKSDLARDSNCET